MVEDASKIMNGTLKSTGTNNSHLNFDARDTEKYQRKAIDTLTKTLRHYINFKEANAFVVSKVQDKKVTIEILTWSKEDLDLIKDNIIETVGDLKDKIVPVRVPLELKFIRIGGTFVESSITIGDD